MIKENYVVAIEPKKETQLPMKLIAFVDYDEAKKYVDGMRKNEYIEDVRIFYKINESVVG